jgi:hypothetical protein
MDPIKTMVATLGRIREMYGEEKFKFAAAHSARMVLAQYPDKKDEIREALLQWVDLNDILDGPPPAFPGQMPTGATSPDDMMQAALRQQMPGIQSQAQFNVVLAAFDALKITLNAIFLGNKEAAAKGRDSVLQALETAEKVTELTVKLSQVPEAATSKAAEEFKAAPKEFGEYDAMKSLLLELDTMDSVVRLTQWYTVNRARIDQVVSQSYRNELLDSIRAKKNALTAADK